jgi:hypothetical protein
MAEQQQRQGAPDQQRALTGQYGGVGMGQQSRQMGQQSRQIGQQTGQVSQMGGHSGQVGQMGQTSQMGQQMGMGLSEVETQQQRAAVEDITRAIQVCEWCADQCIQEADPMMVECIRLCRDVSELGETVLGLLPRNSRYAQAVLQTFDRAVQACAQECSQHTQGHCQECAEELVWTTDSVGQLLATFGQQPGIGGQQPGIGGQQPTTTGQQFYTG